MMSSTYADLTSQLGVSLDSPISWLHYPGPGDSTSYSSPSKRFSSFEDRDLTSNDEYTDYFVDDDGNSYEPYSLAWRYLGMFIECENDQDDDFEDEHNKRGLSSDDGNNNCARKVLWAAYRDPDYSGGSIGEYQYYNISTGEYDDTYCRSERCVKMDCHEPEPETDWQLIGVFKETDGLEDFAEQLFKHEGYCIWDYDTFDLMSTYRETLPNSCKQLHLPDHNGNYLYMNIRPIAQGDITLGVYKDEFCTTPSKLSLQDYIEMFYNSEGDARKGQDIARAWTKAIKRWNKHMSIYKVCQPCRAHNFANGNAASVDRYFRLLDENDGEGDAEQWGYDCYDNAGYTNCNQCYKFQSKTYWEVADAADLRLASRQGTILDIRVDGKRYGKGGYFKRFPKLSKFVDSIPKWFIHLCLTLAILAALAISAFFATTVGRKLANTAMLRTFLEWIRERLEWIRDRLFRKGLPNAFKEHFHLEDDKTFDMEGEDGKPKKPVSYVYA